MYSFLYFFIMSAKFNKFGYIVCIIIECIFSDATNRLWMVGLMFSGQHPIQMSCLSIHPLGKKFGCNYPIRDFPIDKF